VHFSNAITPNALVVEVVEGTANIPNILLQNDFDIKAFGYCGQSVRESYIINVIGRTKPDDYIYTETELKTWETLKTDVETVKEDVETLKTDVETVKEETQENSLLLNTKPGLKFANGEIFNDYIRNYSENDYSHAEGTGTRASGKVFKVINAVPYLDNTGYIELDSKQGIEIGMIYSIVGEAAHHHCGKVIEIDKGSAYIKVENFPTNYQRNPKEDEKYSIHNYFMIDGHPELGTTEIGFAAHAEGYDTKAANTAAHAEGKETIVVGKYGHAEGKSTLAGHAAHAEGSNTIASGDASHAEGESTKAIGSYSHTEGINT
jgi:hypothetical protein